MSKDNTKISLSIYACDMTIKRLHVKYHVGTLIILDNKRYDLLGEKITIFGGTLFSYVLRQVPDSQQLLQEHPTVVIGSMSWYGRRPPSFYVARPLQFFTTARVRMSRSYCHLVLWFSRAPST